MIRKLYPYPPRIYESLPGVHKTCYYNVELSAYLKIKAKELLIQIGTQEEKLKRVFLRAFFDDEGSVYWIGNRRAVRGYQHKSKLLYLIQRLLEDFHVESSADEKFNEITITRRKNIEQFEREINFSKGVHVNGYRSNSIWKKSLEKRKILRMALASYL